MGKKNYFFRVDASEFLAAVITTPQEERSAWVLQVALDLVADSQEAANTEYAKGLIAESNGFREKRRESGRLGGLAKASTALAKASTATICSSKSLAKASTPLANSNSNSNSNNKHKYGEFKNVILTDTEHSKLVTKFNGSTDDRIKQMDEGIELKGYKYKSHYLAILNWAKREASPDTGQETTAERRARLSQ